MDTIKMDKQAEADATEQMMQSISPIPLADRTLYDPIEGHWLVRRGLGGYETEKTTWLDKEYQWKDLPEEAVDAAIASINHKGRKFY